jgi:hypothetical protein
MALLTSVLLTAFGVLLLSGCRAGGAPALSVGDPAPSFILPSADGGTHSLSQLLEQRDVLRYCNMAYG